VLRSEKSRNVVNDVFRSGKRYTCDLITVVISSSPQDNHNRGLCIAIAGKRLGNAVLRNRARRVVREGALLVGGPWPGYRVAIVARDSLTGVPPERVAAQLGRILQKAKVVRGV